MRLIDADALDKRIYNDVPISTFGSIRRMAAVRELIEEAPTIDSIYGYKIEDLVALAATLENDCVVPRDLSNYHDERGNYHVGCISTYRGYTEYIDMDGNTLHDIDYWMPIEPPKEDA